MRSSRLFLVGLLLTLCVLNGEAIGVKDKIHAGVTHRLVSELTGTVFNANAPSTETGPEEGLHAFAEMMHGGTHNFADRFQASLPRPLDDESFWSHPRNYKLFSEHVDNFLQTHMSERSEAFTKEHALDKMTCDDCNKMPWGTQTACKLVNCSTDRILASAKRRVDVVTNTASAMATTVWNSATDIWNSANEYVKQKIATVLTHGSADEAKLAFSNAKEFGTAEQHLTALDIFLALLFGFGNGFLMGLFDVFRKDFREMRTDAVCIAKFEKVKLGFNAVINSGFSMLKGIFDVNEREGKGIADFFKYKFSIFAAGQRVFFEALWELVTQCQPLTRILLMLVFMAIITLIFTLILWAFPGIGWIVYVVGTVLSLIFGIPFLWDKTKKFAANMRVVRQNSRNRQAWINIIEAGSEIAGCLVSIFITSGAMKLLSSKGRGEILQMLSRSELLKMFKGTFRPNEQIIATTNKFLFAMKSDKAKVAELEKMLAMTPDGVNVKVVSTSVQNGEKTTVYHIKQGNDAGNLRKLEVTIKQDGSVGYSRELARNGVSSTKTSVQDGGFISVRRTIDTKAQTHDLMVETIKENRHAVEVFRQTNLATGKDIVNAQGFTTTGSNSVFELVKNEYEQAKVLAKVVGATVSGAQATSSSKRIGDVTAIPFEQIPVIAGYTASMWNTPLVEFFKKGVVSRDAQGNLYRLPEKWAGEDMTFGKWFTSYGLSPKIKVPVREGMEEADSQIDRARIRRNPFMLNGDLNKLDLVPRVDGVNGYVLSSRSTPNNGQPPYRLTDTDNTSPPAPSANASADVNAEGSASTDADADASASADANASGSDDGNASGSGSGNGNGNGNGSGDPFARNPMPSMNPFTPIDNASNFARGQHSPALNIATVIPGAYNFFRTKYAQCMGGAKDQGAICNSCWAQAAATILSSHVCANLVDEGRPNVSFDASALHLLACTSPEEDSPNNCSLGGTIASAMNFASGKFALTRSCVETAGAGSVEDDTVKDLCGKIESSCLASRSAMWSPSGVRAVRSTKKMMRVILAYGPIGSLMNLPSLFQGWAGGGVYIPGPNPVIAAGPNGEVYRHFVVIHGWGTDYSAAGALVDYWLCENSWGNIYAAIPGVPSTQAFFMIQREGGLGLETNYSAYPSMEIINKAVNTEGRN